MKAALTYAGGLAVVMLCAGCVAAQPEANDVLDVAGASAPEPSQEKYLVELSAADFDRAAEVVTFKYPAGLRRQDMGLWDAWGGKMMLPVQVDANGTATVFIPNQKAGETMRLAFRPLPKTIPKMIAPGNPPDGKMTLVPNPELRAVSVTKETGRLRFDVEGKPVFYYQMDLAEPPRPGIDQKIWRGAFLYPLYTPKGVEMSDSYPADHPHDHGIWTAWASSHFQGRHVDFWNPHYAYGGTVAFTGLDRTWEGPVDGGFESRHQSIDRTVQPPVAALNEQWKVTLYAAHSVPARIFDLEFTQAPATTDPLDVDQYTYGGLGVRGHAQWLDKNNLQVLTSAGTTNRVQANNQPARWFFIGGNIDGTPVGIAALCHPDNFRAPQTVRMNPDQPFFMYAPNISAGFTISKEQPYVGRYRFIIQDGPPDAKFLEACWQGYAHPATATVVVK